MVRNSILLAAVPCTAAVESFVQQRVLIDVNDYDYEDTVDYAGKGKSGKESPTPRPTRAPTLAPTDAPTVAPTVRPTPAPTEAPTQSTPTWTGWVNSWDQPVDWTASSGYVMTGVHSKHDNGKEDRLWDFQQSKMLSSTHPVRTGFVNDWDGEFTYGDDSKVFVGMYSEHDNRREDRRFKIDQSTHGVTASGCYWTGETNWDAEWTVAGNSGEAITAMWSRHDNGKEDRLFKFRFCRISSDSIPPSAPIQSVAAWTGWVNSWDQPVDWTASNGYVMTGVHSKHDNGKEDRLWDFQHSQMFSSTNPVRTDFVNDWDGEFTYGDDSKVFVGMYSEHDNRREDRRFKIDQSTLPMGVAASGCYWTGETAWDAEWTLAGNSGEGITGMWSRHDNGKEDRLFKFRFCRLA